jgi:hypothetical protein
MGTRVTKGYAFSIFSPEGGSICSSTLCHNPEDLHEPHISAVVKLGAEVFEAARLSSV